MDSNKVQVRTRVSKRYAIILVLDPLLRSRSGTHICTQCWTSNTAISS